MGTCLPSRGPSPLLYQPEGERNRSIHPAPAGGGGKHPEPQLAPLRQQRVGPARTPDGPDGTAPPRNTMICTISPKVSKSHPSPRPFRAAGRIWASEPSRSGGAGAPVGLVEPVAATPH